VTRIPELEQELVAAAARLRSPRRVVRPAMRVALAAAALAAAVVIAIVGAVDHDRNRGAQPSAPTRPPNPDMIDHEAGVAFALEGRVLTVRLLPSAPHETRLKVDGKRIRATCAKGFTDGPGPGPGPDPRQTSTRLWPAGRAVMRFRFAGDISRIATTCRLEDPVAGHVAFIKFRRSRPSPASDDPVPPNGIENSPQWAAFTPEQRIEEIGNRWARRFAASGAKDCRFTTQPLCERLACERISGPIENCTLPSRSYRESFRGATVQDVAIKGERAAARFSNGEMTELVHIDGYVAGGLWWIYKLGGNAGRGFFK
jgi:hypothetical protein